MKCVKCKKRESTDTHHIDGDHKNNTPKNILNICTLCHAEIHGISPKKSELKRQVIFRDRVIKTRNVIENQIRGFSRIEYKIPDKWDTELKIWNDELKQIEKKIKTLLDSGDYPLWERLKEVKGISYNTSAKLISYIDIANSRYVSSLWRYCGLDATHIKRTKGCKEGDAKKFGVPFLKKEILGVLADSFIKQRTQPYRGIYDSEKERQLNNNGITKGHAHRRAIRKMMKVFMSHYYAVDKEVNGLVAEKPFVQERLGHENIIQVPF